MTASFPLPITLLPHSYPFVLIDRIIEFEEGDRIVCLKNVSINEDFFNGHFKGNPAMPETLILEAMAQAAGLTIGGGENAAYLSGVSDAKFKKPVIPGDQLIIKSSVLQRFHPLYVFEVKAYVADEAAAEAEITLSVI